MACDHVLPCRMVLGTAKGLQEFQQGPEGDWQVSVVPTPERVGEGLLWTF